jgi:Abortive infection C-terminus
MWTMANLKYGEKDDFEALLGMRTGYVLDFTNRQFREFVLDSVRLDIEDPTIGSTGSKAVRLRHFWNNQPDHIVGRLMKDLVERTPDDNATLRKRCTVAAERLSKSAAVQDASVISEFSGVEDFEQLAAGVRDSIAKNEPEAGLDRLHTFTVKFVRWVSQRRGLTVDRDKSLNAVFGMYVKKLQELKLIESRMTELILKTSISVLDAFNDVRNNRSLAHDNVLLNREESLLIFNHVTTAIQFIWTLEQSISKKEAATNVL